MHHEGGIAQDILKKILSEAKRRGLSKVKLAKVIVGEANLAQPDNIKFSFESISQGTIAQGAKLDIRLTKLKARCSSCKSEYDLSASLSCPHCKGKEIDIFSGQELLVESVE
jgi:hydrogenase nickel incorporation protein HypA/HybF